MPGQIKEIVAAHSFRLSEWIIDDGVDEVLGVYEEHLSNFHGKYRITGKIESADSRGDPGVLFYLTSIDRKYRVEIEFNEKAGQWYLHAIILPDVMIITHDSLGDSTIEYR